MSTEQIKNDLVMVEYYRNTCSLMNMRSNEHVKEKLQNISYPYISIILTIAPVLNWTDLTGLARAFSPCIGY